jgi:hypothetical protein
MAHFFECDGCKSKGSVSPKSEQLFTKQEGSDKAVPVMEEIVTQDANGNIVKKLIPKMRDLETRIHIVRLSFGVQVVQRDLCGICLPKIKAEAAALFNKLAQVGQLDKSIPAKKPLKSKAAVSGNS